MRFPYYEELKIAHFFYTMHIRKNVVETLWRTLDGRSEKEKVVKISTYIQEANHAMRNLIYSIEMDTKIVFHGSLQSMKAML
jgi:hypothetical protein